MTLAEALRAAAQHVEEHKATLSLDGSENDSARLAEVSALGHDLDSLAAARETARVYPREYEAIRSELQRRGFTLAPEVDQTVAGAFEAERPAHAPPVRCASGWGEPTMILTGRQIRQARMLLGLNRSRLASKVGCITTLVIVRAEENEDELLPIDQATAIRRTLEQVGVEFDPEGVRLRKVEP